MSNGRLAAATGAVLCFFATYGAGYLSFSGDQLWIFQRLMGFVALGLFLIFAIGMSVGDWTSRALEKLDGWILERPVRAGVLLSVLILTYFVSWCGVSFLRHYYFHSSYDLGIMDQVVWNTSQGHWFARSIEVANDLGDHVRLYLAALSLVYLAIPSPYVLLTFQSLVLGLSALPLYILARRKFDSPAIGLAVACCALAYPPLGFLNRYDFHSEVLSIPLLIAAYERIDVADLKSASLLMALTLFTKENLGLNLAMLGIMAGFYKKHWRFGLSWAFIGIAYSLIALLVVIPAFRGEPSDTLARYQWLGDSPSQMLWGFLSQPVFVVGRILAGEHILTLLQLLAPLAFLPLLGLPALLPAAPTLIYNFLAEWPSQTVIYQHYMVPVIPFVLIAAIIGLHRLVTNPWVARFLNTIPTRGLRSNRQAGLGVSVMLAAILTSWIYENPITGNASLVWGKAPEIIPMGKEIAVPMIWPNDAAIRQGLRLVPRNVPVLTTTNYAPHLSHRPWIEMIPRAPVQTLEPKVEVIFLNLRDLRFWSCDDYFATLTAAAQSNFGVVFYRDDVILVQKGQAGSTKLKSLLDDWPGCR
jgi:uncharacterized membrane protein